MTLSLLLSILLMQGAAGAQGGIVAGTLRGPDGKAAASVRVGIMAIPEAGRGLRGAGTLVYQGQTDDDGKFQMEGVQPGRYYIVAGRVSTPTFYPGVLKIDTAKTIEVRAMTAVRDIDFVVDTSSSNAVSEPSLPPSVSVTGRIVLRNNPDAPMPPIITVLGSRVQERNTNFLPPAIQQLVQTPPLVVGTSVSVGVARDGSFSLTLPPGQQRLTDVSLAEGYSVAAVTSAGRNVLNQLVDVKAGFDLVVSVDVGDIRPRYRLIALVLEGSTNRVLAGDSVELVSSSGEVQRLPVNAQGTVTFPRVAPGTYLLRLASGGFDMPDRQVIIKDGSVQVELRARKKP